MTGPDRRIIVEGVEFAQLVQFPRILRAVTAAFQLPRLVIGLFLIVTLVVGGRVWDSVFDEASVSPDGLMAVPWTDDDAAEAQQVLRAELARYGVTIEEPADGVLGIGLLENELKAFSGNGFCELENRIVRPAGLVSNPPSRLSSGVPVDGFGDAEVLLVKC